MTDEKAILRREMMARRVQAFADVPGAGVRLVDHFPRDIEIGRATIVGSYMPFRSEIDPHPLLQNMVRRGAHAALPRISAFPLCGFGEYTIVGVGGASSFAELPDSSRFEAAPHPPTPSPPGGRGVSVAGVRAKKLRMTPTIYEQRLWDLLRAKRPSQTHWRRQVVIGGYVFDFGCHRLKLLVEVDGGVHKLSSVQERDARKVIVASEHGYRLIRLQNEDVMKLETGQFFDQFVSKSPSPLWGGVGVGGASAFAELADNSASKTTPHSLIPCASGAGRNALTFHLCDPDNPDHFQQNKWGIFEPNPDFKEVTPDILLVPLLGFDKSGNRLGYGKGYYDQAIANLNATTIGLAFAAQEVPEIPTQPHDQRLDWIITENGAYRTPS